MQRYAILFICANLLKGKHKKSSEKLLIAQNDNLPLSRKSFILSFFHIFLKGGMSGAKKTHKYILLNNNIYL
jgi:hypothetical protein